MVVPGVLFAGRCRGVATARSAAGAEHRHRGECEHGTCAARAVVVAQRSTYAAGMSAPVTTEVIAPRLLVAIDGSTYSLRALKRAIELAKAFGAEILVMEVIEDFGPLPGKYDAPPAGMDRTVFLAEQRFADARALLDDSGVVWTRRIEEGYPAEVICSAAEQERIMMIVIGSRGLSPVGRFLIGSVSDRVVHHAPCSVMVVK